MVDGNKHYITGYQNLWKYEVTSLNDNLDSVFLRTTWIPVKTVKEIKFTTELQAFNVLVIYQQYF